MSSLPHILPFLDDLSNQQKLQLDILEADGARASADALWKLVIASWSPDHQKRYEGNLWNDRTWKFDAVQAENLGVAVKEAINERPAFAAGLLTVTHELLLMRARSSNKTSNSNFKSNVAMTAILMAVTQGGGPDSMQRVRFLKELLAAGEMPKKFFDESECDPWDSNFMMERWGSRCLSSVLSTIEEEKLFPEALRGFYIGIAKPRAEFLFGGSMSCDEKRLAHSIEQGGRPQEVCISPMLTHPVSAPRRNSVIRLIRDAISLVGACATKEGWIVPGDLERWNFSTVEHSLRVLGAFSIDFTDGADGPTSFECVAGESLQFCKEEAAEESANLMHLGLWEGLRNPCSRNGDVLSLLALFAWLASVKGFGSGYKQIDMYDSIITCPDSDAVSKLLKKNRVWLRQEECMMRNSDSENNWLRYFAYVKAFVCLKELRNPQKFISMGIRYSILIEAFLFNNIIEAKGIFVTYPESMIGRERQGDRGVKSYFSAFKTVEEFKTFTAKAEIPSYVVEVEENQRAMTKTQKAKIKDHWCDAMSKTLQVTAICVSTVLYGRLPTKRIKQQRQRACGHMLGPLEFYSCEERMRLRCEACRHDGSHEFRELCPVIEQRLNFYFSQWFIKLLVPSIYGARRDRMKRMEQLLSNNDQTLANVQLLLREGIYSEKETPFDMQKLVRNSPTDAPRNDISSVSEFLAKSKKKATFVNVLGPPLNLCFGEGAFNSEPVVKDIRLTSFIVDRLEGLAELLELMGRSIAVTIDSEWYGILPIEPQEVETVQLTLLLKHDRDESKVPRSKDPMITFVVDVSQLDWNFRDGGKYLPKWFLQQTNGHRVLDGGILCLLFSLLPEKTFAVGWDNDIAVLKGHQLTNHGFHVAEKLMKYNMRIKDIFQHHVRHSPAALEKIPQSDISKISLRILVKSLFKGDIQKGEQRSYWRHRPIALKSFAYASLDSLILMMIYLEVEYLKSPDTS